MKIPIIATQFASFGPIARQLVDNHDAKLTRVFVKKTFSVFGESFICQHLKTLKRVVAVVYGFDTVECIIQTCKDLVDLGYRVIVMIDAVSSF